MCLRQFSDLPRGGQSKSCEMGQWYSSYLILRSHIVTDPTFLGYQYLVLVQGSYMFTIATSVYSACRTTSTTSTIETIEVALIDPL